MRSASFVVLGIALAGCGGAKVEPVVASSSHEAVYAATYPAELHDIVARFGDKQKEANKTLATFKQFASRLHDPAWPRVVEVYKAADRAGQSDAYAERNQRTYGARTFFDAEHDEIGRKVGGSAQYVVKKKSCDVEVGGVVVGALKESVDKQLEKETRDVSEAHVLIDRYRTPLKKENVPELEKQADAIEAASFTVHIELVALKVRLRKMIDEADDVKQTQDDFVSAEVRWQGEKGTTDADKKDSNERIGYMKKGGAGLDASVQQARAMEPHMEDNIAAAQKAYDQAFDDLIASAKK